LSNGNNVLNHHFAFVKNRCEEIGADDGPADAVHAEGVADALSNNEEDDDDSVKNYVAGCIADPVHAMPLWQKLAALQEKVTQAQDDVAAQAEILQAKQEGDINLANELFFDRMEERRMDIESSLSEVKREGLVEAVRKKARSGNAPQEQLRIRSGSTPLDQFAPSLWFAVFPIAFYLGDGAPGIEERKVDVSLSLQTTYLLRRSELQFGCSEQSIFEPFQQFWPSQEAFDNANDYRAPATSRWQSNTELNTVLFDIGRKEECYKGISAHVGSPAFQRTLNEVSKIKTEHVAAAVRLTGDAGGYEEVLKNKNVDRPVKEAIRHLRLATRSIIGTESFRKQILHQLEGMRCWLGPSIAFVTVSLNAYANLSTNL
jgi:hypothetical protein